MSLKYEWLVLVTLKYGSFSFHWRSMQKMMSSALKSRVGVKFLFDVPLDALAQVEGVVQAVGRDGPALGQARHDGGAAALEVDDAAVDLAVGVERGAGGVDAGVEVLRAAFRAEHQRLGRRGAGGESVRPAWRQRQWPGLLAGDARGGYGSWSDSLGGDHSIEKRHPYPRVRATASVDARSTTSARRGGRPPGAVERAQRRPLGAAACIGVRAAGARRRSRRAGSAATATRP